MQSFVTNFSMLSSSYADAVPDEVYSEFIDRFRPNWATRAIDLVGHEPVKNNRSGFYDFYTDERYALSVRSDPRSGMFVRDPKADGGKVECLFFLSLGLEGFAQTLAVLREVNGNALTVALQGNQLGSDFGGFQDDQAKIRGLIDQPGNELEWSDDLVRPHYEDALLTARDAVLAANHSAYDPSVLFQLKNLVLCGAHCPGQKGGGGGIIANKMGEIFAVGAAIRFAAKRLIVS